MKKIIAVLLLTLLSQNTFSQAGNWMESMDFAKRMARSQNKLILMVWEEATEYPLPVLIQVTNGRKVVLDNLFESKELNDLIWEYFVPVKISEEFYGDMLKEIKGKRRQSYIDSFSDDSLKILDANGNIIGTSGAFVELLNFTKFVLKYRLDTSYIKQEIFNYHTNKDFYSTFYLASKYLDFSLLVNQKVRSEILKLSDIYFAEAEALLNTDTTLDTKEGLQQRVLLTQMIQDLIKNKPRKVLRQLKKMSGNAITKNNKSLVKYLYYTSYKLLNDKEEFEPLEKEISLLNLRQAQLIVNLNR